MLKKSTCFCKATQASTVRTVRSVLGAAWDPLRLGLRSGTVEARRSFFNSSTTDGRRSATADTRRSAFTTRGKGVGIGSGLLRRPPATTQQHTSTIAPPKTAERPIAAANPLDIGNA